MIVAALLFGAALAAPAADATFTGTGAGANWFTPGNWSGSALPTSTGTATITGGRDALVSGGTSTIYALTILQNSNVTASGSNTLLNVMGNTGTGGLIRVWSGTLALTNGARMDDNVSGVELGFSGTGVLVITTGGTLSTYFADFGMQAGDVGIATISGSNSAWTADGGLNVGVAGTGSMSITDGARVYSPGGNVIAQRDGSTGAVTVSGPGSTWDTGGNSMTLGGGENSTATLRVENGALVTLTGNFTSSPLILGYGAGSTGTLIQTGGTVSMGELQIGTGTGTYRLEGGVLEVARLWNAYGGTPVLELASGTIRAFSPNSLEGEIDATLRQGTTSTINTNGLSGTWSGVLSGSGALNKAGGGTLSITGDNTYSGGTFLTQGGIFFGHNNAIGTGTLSVQGNTLIGALSVARTVANNITINPGFTLTGTGGQNLTLTGTISGAGAVTKLGTGTLSLTGANTYAGNTALNQGALYVGNDQAIGSGTLTIGGNTNLGSFNGARALSNNVVVNSGFTGTFTGTSNLTLTGTISGAGGLAKTGTATLLISGTNNTYTGKTTIRSGTVAIQGIGSLGNPSGVSAAIDLGATSTTAALVYLGATGTLARTINLAGSTGGAILDASGAGTFTISGTVLGSAAGAKILTLTGTNAGLNTISGPVSNGSGSVSLVKSGSGTWRLTGNNAYTGTTTISGGRLIASNIVVASGSSHLGNASTAVILGGAATSGTLSYAGNSATYTRGFTVNAGGGGLDVSTAGQTLTIGTNGVATAGVFTVSGSGNTTMNTAVTGAGSLRKAGSGVLTLTGSSNFAGGTIITGGTLAAQNNHAVGTATVVVDGGVFYVESGATVGNAVTLSGGGYNRTLSGNLLNAVNASSDLDGVNTTARLAAGSVAVATTLETSFVADSSALNDNLRRSDVYAFEGTGENLFVLELAITSAEANLFLAWLDEETNLWTNAVEGNDDNNASGAQQGFAGTFAQFQAVPGYGTDLGDYVGAWGSSTALGVTTVWAVLNHNSDFAIVPEPGTILLVTLGLGTVLFRRRR